MTDSSISESGDESFESALKLYEEERFDEAIVQFGLAAKHGYRRESVENNIGACYQRLGKPQDAERHYRLALEHNPNNLFALKNLGGILRSRGSWRDAERLLAKAVRLDPEDIETRFGLVQCLLRTNRYPGAMRVLRPLRDKELPDELVRELFRELADAGAFQEITDIWTELPGRQKKVRELARMAGEAYFELGEPDRAAELFRRLLEEQWGGLEQSLLGLAEMLAGRREAGLRQIREADMRAGDDPNVLENVAFALHGNDDLEEVLAIYGKLADLRPDDRVVWNNWGNALYNLGRFKESISKFVRAVENDPDYEIAWNNIGNALEKLGLYAEALPYHRRAIEIAPKFDYAHYAEAMALYGLGRSAEAARAIDRAIALSPTFPEAWALKARLELVSSPDDAVRYAERALELDPQSHEHMVLTAAALSASGRIERAETLLQRARKLALASGDLERLRRLDEMMTTGLSSSAVVGNGVFDGSAEVAGPTDASIDSEGESRHWYKSGVDALRRGDLTKALRLFRLCFLMDRESSAPLALLLRYEARRVRLREYLSAANRLAAEGLATPTLKRRIEEAAEKLRER